ncbi:MAG: Fur family transcriptional regulator [Propionibacteriaceae bacterium]|nr:Fur family transcriptional regulator [Propionibacteriaceae bacterium]
MSTNLPSPKDRLRSVGLRVTAARLAVIDIISEHPHATVDEIRDLAIGRLGSLSVQATYDVLAALHGARLIRRIEPAGQPPRYEMHLDNHHHLMCRGCGRLQDTECHVGTAPCLAPVSTHGFVVDEAEVIFWGLCPSCNTTEGSA